MKAQEFVRSILERIGIAIDGPNPWDIQVHDDRFYDYVVAKGSLGLGESYVAGWWDCPQLQEFFARLLTSDIVQNEPISFSVVLQRLRARLVNVQTPKQAQQLADTHYNLGNDLFRAMLGKTMAYSCAYWKDAGTLDEAQEAKLDLICRKIDIGPNDRVLDIGCGWGSFARFAAERYGCQVTGLTVAKEQAELAREFCAGLPVEIHCCDYRNQQEYRHTEPFDKIVSVGMIEHVGYRNYRTLMKTVSDVIAPGGLFLLQTIGGHVSTTHTSDAWFDKYIFPGGMFPSIRQLGASVEGLFVVEDLHNFGADYGKTLMAWWQNFENYWKTTNRNEMRLSHPGTAETFYRMWRYYLLSCSANFRIRGISLWQIVLSKGGVAGGYATVR